MPVVAWFTDPLVAELLKMAEKALPWETGGLLLGYRVSDSEVVVNQIIGPGPRAVHRLDSFNPDAAWQAGEIAERYADAGRNLDYLGDWHTHPQGSANLSRRDRKTLRLIANDAA